MAVQVETLEAVEIPRTRSAVGSLRSPETARLSAEIAGAVVAVDVPEGRPVEGGHVLARIDDEEIRAAVSIAAAEFRKAKDRLRRVRMLREENVMSGEELDNAQADFDATKGALTEARARLGKTEIRAPFDGIVGLRRVSAGDYVRPGDPVVEITRTAPLDLVFGLPQRYAREVEVGQKVYATAGRCGERFEGEVAAIDPVVDSASRSLMIEARVANPDGALLPGMAAHVRVVVGAIERGVRVPREAVVRQGTKHLVYTLDDGNHAEPREVALGEFFADDVAISSGLEPGDRIVTSGHQKLRPGALTKPSPHEKTENPNLSLGWPGPAADC